MKAEDLERTFWRNVSHIALGLIVIGALAWGFFFLVMYLLYTGRIG
jgi:hypothetical protein